MENFYSKNNENTFNFTGSTVNLQVNSNVQIGYGSNTTYSGTSYSGYSYQTGQLNPQNTSVSAGTVSDYCYIQHPEKSILTEKELRKTKGLENISEAEANNIIYSLHTLSNMLYESFKEIKN